MRRTQLYLDEEMARALTAESRRRGTTVSELVREAVAAAYGCNEAADRGGIIRRLAGVWADRADLGETDAFVRGVRRSRRPERWRRAHTSGGGGGKVSSRQRRDH